MEGGEDRVLREVDNGADYFVEARHCVRFDMITSSVRFGRYGLGAESLGDRYSAP